MLSTAPTVASTDPIPLARAEKLPASTKIHIIYNMLLCPAAFENTSMRSLSRPGAMIIAHTEAVSMATAMGIL